MKQIFFLWCILFSDSARRWGEKVIILGTLRDRLYKISSLSLRGMLRPCLYCFLALKSFLTFPLLTGWTPYVGKKCSPLIPYNLPTYFFQTNGSLLTWTFLRLFYSSSFIQSIGNALPPLSDSGTLKSDLTFLLPVNTNRCPMNWNWNFFLFIAFSTFRSCFSTKL